MEDQEAAPGKEVILPVSVKDFNDVSGYQFTLNWDPKVLEFVRVEHAGLEGAYGTHSVGKGKLTTVWAEPNGRSLSLEDGTQVFNVRFRVIGENGTVSKMEINSSLTRGVAYTGSLEQLSVKSESAQVKVKAPGYALYQNYPNPFSQNGTSIRFSIPQQEEVSISIYNSVGQLVRTYKTTYAAGEHELSWDGKYSQGHQLGKGTYFYRMEAGRFREVKRALIL
ncbi:cohesin domain-containing protein [Pontibacter harenae]|uniref:cohesin domain-containing protein n=1 Tax=Pontibacter harenae TaxID=2894083 RepID=UPI001E418566|nr:cohesin domain-containing protein [Pontibacter harenae]MCC9166860.1 T9SS type A sorting domain-containing protein [Pontibacter harenae]